jgi:hypothetical protein
MRTGDNALVHDPQETQGPNPLAGSDLKVFTRIKRPSRRQHNRLFVLLGTRPPVSDIVPVRAPLGSSASA